MEILATANSVNGKATFTIDTSMPKFRITGDENNITYSYTDDYWYQLAFCEGTAKTQLAVYYRLDETYNSATAMELAANKFWARIETNPRESPLVPNSTENSTDNN